MTRFTKYYASTSLGQVHCRRCEATANSSKPPLICLHPAPYSGLYFETVMPLLNARRDIHAPDYPGYGGSARQDKPPRIDDYAESMLQVVETLAKGGPVDVLGFHTGCLVGLEMALQKPDRIGQLILCDVPFFTADVRPGLREKMAKPMPVTAELQSLESIWSFNVSKRVNDVPLPRALDLFAEQLRGGMHDYFAFDAAFAYPCEEKFAALDKHVDIIATQSGLLEPSRAAAAALSQAHLTEALEIKTAVFESGATAFSKRLLHILDQQHE